jgi:DNA-binding PadR family transcriptional regulator
MGSATWVRVEPVYSDELRRNLEGGHGLHRLEKQKLIAAEWKISENNQRTRVYKLTTKGKKQLVSERSRWSQLSDAIAGVLNPAKSAGDA